MLQSHSNNSLTEIFDTLASGVSGCILVVILIIAELFKPFPKGQNKSDYGNIFDYETPRERERDHTESLYRVSCLLEHYYVMCAKLTETIHV